MKNYILFFALIVISFNGLTQEYEVPKSYTLESTEDYENYEDEVISAINWYQNTTVKENSVKRKSVTTFLMKWLMGSPSVSIELSQDLVPFMDCSECLMSFMNGWAKYSLQNDTKDKVACAHAALEHVIAFYEKNETDLGKISSIKKLAKKQKKGKLKSFVESVL